MSDTQLSPTPSTQSISSDGKSKSKHYEFLDRIQIELKKFEIGTHTKPELNLKFNNKEFNDYITALEKTFKIVTRLNQNVADIPRGHSFSIQNEKFTKSDLVLANNNFSDAIKISRNMSKYPKNVLAPKQNQNL